MTVVANREIAHQVWLYTLQCQDCGWLRIGVKESMLRGRDTVIEKRVKCCRIPPLSVEDAARAAILKSYTNNAKRYGRRFTLTEREFYDLIGQVCFYCGTPPSNVVVRTQQEFHYNGIDRVDSKGGYTPGNAVACCWTCNQAKRARDQKEFIAWIKRCADHLG